MYSGYHEQQPVGCFPAPQPPTVPAEPHSAYYHQGLGTAGHRVYASVNYLPSYSQVYSGPQQMMVPHQQNPAVFAQNAAVPSQNAHAPAEVAHHQPEEPNGGISLVLEYNINNMSTFLSWCTFGMLKQNRNPCKQFDEWVVSVLFATRLPKLTIIIALEYMNQRYLKMDQILSMKESDIFTVLIVSLILANKFNDDNTFTNRLWCGATGIDIEILNREEKEWLKAVGWQLNVVQFESNIRTLEACWSTWLDKYTLKAAQPHVSTPPSPAYTDNSILLSPVHLYSNYYYSPVVTLLPTVMGPKYAQDSSIWGYQHAAPVFNHTPTFPSKIWSYGNTGVPGAPAYPYVPQGAGMMGYQNYYNFLMASC